MRFSVFVLFVYFQYGECFLWPKGVVHYSINKKDYDINSQDIIMTTLERIQKELCIKFFYTPVNFTVSKEDKILYISNPDKIKQCPPEKYDYSGSVVNMKIGYKCLNTKEITRMIVDLLRASIQNPVPDSAINSYDLVLKFKDNEHNFTEKSLLAPKDKNFLNFYYHLECKKLSSRIQPPQTRRFLEEIESGDALTEQNKQYYKDKLWPMGIVLYTVDERLKASQDYVGLQHAMMSIELGTCVVFHETNKTDQVLEPENILNFGVQGEDMPALGFTKGKQDLNFIAMVQGTAGHTSHTLNLLFRILGIPMMSNRYDRDNHIIINWKNIQSEKQQYFEKVPEDAWLKRIPYDLESVTHAPANYLCNNCELGQTTVQPIQDHLWQKTIIMGHQANPSEWDLKLLNILYGNECMKRFTSSEVSTDGVICEKKEIGMAGNDFSNKVGSTLNNNKYFNFSRIESEREFGTDTDVVDPDPDDSSRIESERVTYTDQYGPDNCTSCETDTDVPDPDTDPEPNPDTHTDTDPEPNPDTDTDTNNGTDTDPSPPGPDTDTDTDPGPPGPDTDTDSNNGTDTEPGPPGPHTDTDTDTNNGTDTDPSPPGPDTDTDTDPGPPGPDTDTDSNNGTDTEPGPPGPHTDTDTDTNNGTETDPGPPGPHTDTDTDTINGTDTDPGPPGPHTDTDTDTNNGTDTDPGLPDPDTDTDTKTDCDTGEIK